MAMTALHFFRLLNIWNGCRVGLGRVEGMFVALIAVYAVLLVFDAVGSCNLSHPRTC